MKCPVCNVDLMMSVRSEVEIDYCPKCRGIWLDRGELDKIIERSASHEREVVNNVRDGKYNDDDYRRDDYRRDDNYDREKQYEKDYYYKKKKKGFLGDLLDFD